MCLGGKINVPINHWQTSIIFNHKSTPLSDLLRAIVLELNLDRSTTIQSKMSLVRFMQFALSVVSIVNTGGVNSVSSIVLHVHF